MRFQELNVPIRLFLERNHSLGPNASRLCGARAASLDATQGPARSCGRGASHRRYYRACSAIRPLWLSQDRRAPAPGGLDNQRQAGRAYLATRGAEGPASAAQARQALADQRIFYIERGSPWENGYIESFNARLRDELLNGEIFYTLREAQIVIESWRRHYNTISRTPQSDTSHQHQRCSCPHSPRGRLRYANRLLPATPANRPTLN